MTKYLLLAALMLPLMALQADAAKRRAVAPPKPQHEMCKVQKDPRLIGSWDDHYRCWKK